MGGLWNVQGQRSDKALCDTMLRGFLSPVTAKRTLVELEKFVVAYAHDLDSNNEVLMAVLIVHMVQSCLQTNDSCSRAFRFLDESGYAVDAVQQLFQEFDGGVSDNEVGATSKQH